MKFLLPALLVGVVHGAQRLDRPRTDGLTESNDASFGSSIVMSHGGDMVFVGEPGDPMLGGAGAVHAFQLSDDGATWSSSHTLEGDRSDGTNTQDSFGYSLAMSGDDRDILLVGAPTEDFEGAVYMYAPMTVNLCIS